MAADNLTAIKDALGAAFARNLVRAWNRSTSILADIPIVAGGGAGGGKNVSWGVEFSGQTASAVKEGLDLQSSEYTADVNKGASLDWGIYRAAFSLTDHEIATARNNLGNPSALDDIFEERMLGALTKIAATINYDVINGTGTATDPASNSVTSIVGLLKALDASTTYATLSKSTYTEWAGNVNANGGTGRALTLALLAAAEQAQFTASNSSPELLYMSPGCMTKYEGLFNQVTRFIGDEGARGMSGGVPMERLFWRGRAVKRDKDIPTGTILGLRPSEMSLRVLPWAPLPQGFPADMRQLMQSDGEASRALGAFAKAYPLGRTGSTVKIAVELTCQLRVDRTNRHFLVQDITES